MEDTEIPTSNSSRSKSSIGSIILWILVAVLAIIAGLLAYILLTQTFPEVTNVSCQGNELHLVVSVDDSLLEREDGTYRPLKGSLTGVGEVTCESSGATYSCSVPIPPAGGELEFIFSAESLPNIIEDGRKANVDVEPNCASYAWRQEIDFGTKLAQLFG
jgi:hypothetical protein